MWQRSRWLAGIALGEKKLPKIITLDDHPPTPSNCRQVSQTDCLVKHPRRNT
jgi:hypothetical protein